MLPKETSVRQLKKLRAETKGTDIGDLTKDDRLNHNIPNLQYIGNPVDTGIESWEEFSKKDSKVQTIAFKSKLVNKPIVKENKKENMKDIRTFEDFYTADDTNNPDLVSRYEEPEYDDRDVDPSYFEEYEDEEFDREKIVDLIYDNSNYELEDLEEMTDDDLKDIYQELDLEQEFDDNVLDDLDDDLDKLEENVKTFEDFENSELDSYTPDDLDHMERGKMEEDDEQEEYERSFDDDDDDDDDDDKIDFFSDFNEKEPESFVEEEIDTDRKNTIDLICANSDYDIEEIEHLTDEELSELIHDLKLDLNDDYDLEESVKTFESFSIPAAKKEEKQPEYTILGKEKEPKSNPNFGIGAVKASEIKKISDFNLIDPPTPKERTIGGSAGVFIDNDTVKGFVNRIDGKDVYIESVDDPMVIKKFNLKDVVKTKKQE